MFKKKSKVSGFKLNPKKDGYRVVTLREIIAEKLINSAKKSDLKKMQKSKDPSQELLENFEQSQEHNHDHSEGPVDDEVYTIAAILDGEVFEVLRAQAKLADMFLAQPKFVLVEEDVLVKIGYKYSDSGFENGEE